MKHGRRIGVIVPANLEYGRQVLQGVRIWCDQHPDVRLDLISESGCHRELPLHGAAPQALVVQDSAAQCLDRLAEWCPYLVVTSNREVVTHLPRVINDDRAIGVLGARYLLSLGYRQLSFATVSRMQFAIERCDGFVAEAAAAGVAVEVHELATSMDAYALVERLSQVAGESAVMAVTDLHARWIMEATADPGQLIPAKFAVLGVDDDILQNSLCPIGLSSVRLAGLRVGFDAAELAMRLARSGRRTVSVQTVPPVDVVVRQSTGALAIRDPLVARTLRLMRDRMGQLADAAAVVEAIGVSRRTLEVHFRAATGRTLAGELARMRVARARELLSDTNLSIKEIAYLVGFSEPRMLSKVFRRLSGELPSGYRNRVQPAYGLAAGDVH